MEQDKACEVDLMSGPSDPYVDYNCKTGVAHIGDLREASGLACVSYPEMTYKLKMDRKYYDPDVENVCKLSGAQLEAVILACQSHTKFFLACDNEHEEEEETRVLPLDDDDEDDQDNPSFFSDESEEEDEIDDESFNDPDDEVPEDPVGPAGGLDDAGDGEKGNMIDEGTIQALGPDTEHEKLYRRGFFLGDGTGTGKTMTLAGIVLENFCNGVRKCLFVTAATGLFKDFKKTLRKLFKPNRKKLKFVNLKREWKVDQDLTETSVQDGIDPCGGMMLVAPVTYRWLTVKYHMQILESWMGDDYSDLMILDEVHNSKSAYKKINPSSQGLSVMQLQYGFPKARVVYSSATAASETYHLLVFPRLQLWGNGTPYKNLKHFQETLNERGVAGLELLAMELKMGGKLTCRQLSFENVNVNFRTVHLSDTFKVTYMRATQLWSLLFLYQTQLKLEYKAKYAENNDMLQKLPQKVAALYQACQSFFGSLMVSSKLAKAESIARHHLKRKMSIIFGLQRTGASKYDMYHKAQNFSMPFSNALCILRIAMLNLGIPLGRPRTFLKDGREVPIGNWHTTTDEKEDSFGCKPPKRTNNLWAGIVLQEDEFFPKDEQELMLLVDETMVVDESKVDLERWLPYTVGSYVFQKHLESPKMLGWSIDEVQARPSLEGFARLYHELCLLLPINPLDELKNRFQSPIELTSMTAGVCSGLEEADSGGISMKEGKYDPEPVAEMTGRKRTYDYDVDLHVWQDNHRDTNVNAERKLFQGHRDIVNYKRVAIISSSASTGFNLHSALEENVHNKEPRIHITIEVGWAAEGLLQQLGRSHRSNQLYQPTYFILWSNVPAEKRFLAMLGRRLRNLGAVSHGHPEGNPHTGHLNDDLCSAVGAKAIQSALEIVEEEHPEIHRLVKILDMFMNNQTGKTAFTQSTASCISQFMNRMMVMPVTQQNKLLSLIEEEMARLQKKQAIYKSLKLLPGKLGDVDLVKKCELVKETFEATLYLLKISRNASWEYMLQVLEKDPLLKFYTYKEYHKKRVLALKYCELLRQYFVIHPYNRNAEKIGEQNLKELAEMDLQMPMEDMEMVKKLWERQLQEMEGERGINKCGHFRAVKLCPYSTPNKEKRRSGQSKAPNSLANCTYQWAVMECILLVGYASAFIPDLVDNPMCQLPVHLGKASFEDDGVKKECVGLYFCMENTSSKNIGGVYKLICNMFKK